MPPISGDGKSLEGGTYKESLQFRSSGERHRFAHQALINQRRKKEDTALRFFLFPKSERCCLVVAGSRDLEMEDQKLEIYHERQKLQFCLLHALNNLFQEKGAFTRAELDAIAEKLVLDDPTQERWTPASLVFKPHHNLITGNYDVNVLISALESKGKSVTWHDRRNGVSSIFLDGPETNGFMGIVLNVPVKRFRGLWRGRHWVSMRRIGGVWYDLDSDLSGPKSFEGVDEVRSFLDRVVSAGGEILLVMNNKE